VSERLFTAYQLHVLKPGCDSIQRHVTFESDMFLFDLVQPLCFYIRTIVWKITKPVGPHVTYAFNMSEFSQSVQYDGRACRAIVRLDDPLYPVSTWARDNVITWFYTYPVWVI